MTLDKKTSECNYYFFIKVTKISISKIGSLLVINYFYDSVICYTTGLWSWSWVHVFSFEFEILYGVEPKVKNLFTSYYWGFVIEGSMSYNKISLIRVWKLRIDRFKSQHKSRTHKVPLRSYVNSVELYIICTIYGHREISFNTVSTKLFKREKVRFDFDSSSVFV